MIGQSIGPYQVLAELGRGGMGEVYRARDTKLNRDVAIKVLPEAFANDSERLARFTREAQTLAALNHPNIAAIYGLEGAALVMELVDGDDLSTLIAAGRIPLADVLALARQMAEALEAAHEFGIVHRDLKPANIKVRADGTVKVLDFGLATARTLDSGVSAGDPANSPTLTARATQMGTILGTAAYMSPEQARGKSVDKRADIWAFGAVVYEMLTGARAFAGDEITDVLAAVLRQDIDWTALPAGTPPRLRRLLERCLDRDAKRRLRDIGEARVELATLEAGGPETAADAGFARPVAPRAPWLPWTVAAACVLGLGGFALWTSLGRTAPAGQLLRLQVSAAANDELSYALHAMGSIALSPDGSVLVSRAAPLGGTAQLFRRRLNELAATPYAGTEQAYAPFFSPDGESVAFAVPAGLKTMSVDGSVPLMVCPLPGSLRGGSWGDDDFLYFAGSGGGVIQRVAATGGTPEVVTTKRDGDGAHRWPHVLPGATAILYTIWPETGIDDAVIVVESIATHERKVLVKGGTDGRYVSSGHLVYMRPEGLMAMPFDLGTLSATGPARQTGERAALNFATGHGRFAVSSAGVLVYEPGAGTPADRSLVWVDRAGVSRPVRPEIARYQSVRMSPDGKWAAVVILDETGGEQIWVLNLERNTIAKRTFEGTSAWPAWTPDSLHLTYMSTRSDGTSNVYRRRADGSGPEERLTTDKAHVQYPNSWSGDGTVLTLEEVGGGLSYLAMTDGKAVRHEVLESSWNKDAPQISLDGKWLAYADAESGTSEIVVQPFPALDSRYLVSSGGGAVPRWSRNGRQLFYLAPPGKMMAVSVTPGSSFTWSTPVRLFEGSYSPEYDVSADGNRFLMIKTPAAARGASHFNVVVNWFSALSRP